MASPLLLSCEFVVEGHVVIFRGNLNRVSAKGILNFNVVLRHHRSFLEGFLPRYTPLLRHQREEEGSCHAIPPVHDTVLELLRSGGHLQYAVAATRNHKFCRKLL